MICYICKNYSSLNAVNKHQVPLLWGEQNHIRAQFWCYADSSDLLDI